LEGLRAEKLKALNLERAAVGAVTRGPPQNLSSIVWDKRQNLILVTDERVIGPRGGPTSRT
jgi:hypothetical protein